MEFSGKTLLYADPLHPYTTALLSAACSAWLSMSAATQAGLASPLAMMKTSAAPIEGFVPEMAIFGIPYVFRDRAHQWKVLDGEIGKELLRAPESKGLIGVCYYDAGSRSFYTINKPILSPEDLKGMRATRFDHCLLYGDDIDGTADLLVGQELP